MIIEMKTAKIFLALFLAAATVFITSADIAAKQPTVIPCNLYTLHTVTGFRFIDGHARVNVDFTGYDDATELRIDIRISKRLLFFLHKEIVSESHTFTGTLYQNEFFYPLEEDGVYDCTVVYTVTGTDGEDVITFTETGNYRLSDYPEHTHIWNESRVEPTCASEGKDSRSCYCGQEEISVLEKLPHTPGEKNTVFSSSGYDKITESCAVCGEIIRSYFVKSEIAPDPSVALISTTPRNLLEDSTFSSQTCDCPSCKLQQSFGKIEAAKPQRPSAPSVPTVDPWKKYQESLNRDTNPYHINQKNNGIRIFP